MENPQYFLGSIAPDSVVMRPGWTKQEKWASHLRDKNLAIWQENVLVAAKKIELTPFQSGYIIHLLTDIFWDIKYNSVFSDLLDKAGVPKVKRNDFCHTYGLHDGGVHG